MVYEATTRAEESIVGRLAQFFPGAMAVRIPVCVTGSGVRSQGSGKKHKNNGNSDGRQELTENTVIEYGTAQEVLFASSLPLEFEDCVHLENADGSLRAEASVVAVQYHDGRMAVAVRFRSAIPNWIIK
ncbi:MAG: hypothetical protein L0Z53_03825 [Acidobacteriales bacterium]|nr:hypothetical protein [Terriglobales bacterium]